MAAQDKTASRPPDASRDNAFSPRTGVKLGYAVDRAEERTGPEDVGEQALIRGLATAFPFFRLGLSRSDVGRRSTIGHIDSVGSSPAVVPSSPLHD
jgi:hypothetical protein